MKQVILERIKVLGGNVDKVEGKSLEEDLKVISFNTVLYPKPQNTPWAKSDEQEPIAGIGDFVEENRTLFKADKARFYDQMLAHFYKLPQEPQGQTVFMNELFTPFTEGTATFEEWQGEWEEADWRQTIKAKDSEVLEVMFIGHSYSYPDHLFVCLADPNPENPQVYGTDHEVFFDEISLEGTLEEYFNHFMTKEELLAIVKAKLEPDE
ncbi:MAG TPA: hypothetical protein DCS93_29300 [Microscillaceae bacterium]|nr:hypothetical protein [Microscillaceae bacterium]